MQSDRVICHVRGAGEPAVVGEIVQKTTRPGEYVVRWPTGDEETVRTSNAYRLVARDTLFFELYVDPAGLRRRFELEPVAVFADVIRTYTGDIRTRTIKEQLRGLGFSQAEIDPAWTKSKRALDAYPGVEIRKSAYHWNIAAAVDRPKLAVEPPPPERPASAELAVTVCAGDIKVTEPSPKLGASTVGPEAGAEAATAEDTAESEALAAPVPVPVTHFEPDQSGHSELLETAPPTTPAAPVPGEPPERTPAASPEVEDETPSRDPFELLVRLKSTGRTNAASAARHLRSASKELDDWALAACLMLPPRPGDDLATAQISTSRWRDVLISLLATPGGIPRSNAARVGLEQLFHRLGTTDPELELDLMLRWVIEASPRVSAKCTPDIDAFLRRIAAEIDVAGTLPTALGQLRDVAQALPLEARGGRARLIAAVYRQSRAEVLDERWWSSATLAELAAAADGALSAVLTDTAVIDRVVRPRLIDRIGSIDGRRAVAEVMGYPAQLATVVDPRQLFAAIRRAANQDAVLNGWLRAITEQDDRDALEADLSTARSARTEAETALRRATDLAGDLRDRLADTEQRMRDQRDQLSTIREAQQRQVRIEGLRVAAEAAIAALTFGDEPSAERAKVLDSLTTSAGLIRVGYVGQTVEFVAEQHELVIGNAQPGQLVIVVRPGYRLDDSAGDHVLARAVVRVAQEE